MKRLDIAIAGAGPAGLSAALFLARDGHRVVLFDQFDKPAPLGSGLIVQPTGQAALKQLGLLQNARSLASRIDAIDGRDAKSGRSVLAVRYDALGRDRHGLGMHRGALFSILFDAVRDAKIAIETGKRVLSLQFESGCRVRLCFDQGGLSAPFDLAIDATGARTCLTEFAARPAKRRELEYGALWASLAWRGEGFDAHALMQRYEAASIMAGVLPIGKLASGAAGQAAFFWSLKPAAYETLKATGLEAWKARVARCWPQAEAYLDQIHSWEDLTLARYGHHTLSVPAGKSIAFVGDSAHSTSPQLGQGANMAMLDAAALAASLREYGDLDQALSDYCRRRLFHVRLFQALSAAFTPFYQSDSAALAWIRDRLIGPVSVIPPGPQLLAAMVGGTIGWPEKAAGLTGGK